MGGGIRVAVIFGGQSGEHEVSLMSATSIINAMDKQKYEIITIGITKEGFWKYYGGPVEHIISGEWETHAVPLEESDYNFVPTAGRIPSAHIDVVFPVLHGPMGEDGTVQGLFELAGLPYVGSGVLSSALCMDKVYTKLLFEKTGLKQAKFTVLMRRQINDSPSDSITHVEREFEYPVFIKPANLGSSVGISKAHNREELRSGLNIASRYDKKVIVEEFIDGHEVECSVLGNEEPASSVVGEIVPCNEFYDYQAKYFDEGKSALIIPARIPDSSFQKVRQLAVKAYTILDCSGMARVDCFVDKKTGEVYINEVNTIPGFTKISMYPKLWEASGVSYSTLIDRLIELAFQRFEQKSDTALI